MLSAMIAGTAAAAFPWAVCAMQGQDWPVRPVTMVVPFPAGGPTDLVARLLAAGLAPRLGQPVIVQNVPGANGIIGMRSVVGAKPDGYTILYNTSSLVLSPRLYLDAGFDPVADFSAVSSTAAIPLVLLVHPDVPAADFPSFLSYARGLGGNLSYASAGSGNVTHLTAVMLMRTANIRALHVPYRGSAPALAGLMAGQTQFMTNPVSDALGVIREGRLRALAVTAGERIHTLPQVPTLQELGMPGLEVTAWHGVVAPNGTPPDIIERLNIAVRGALASDDMQSKLKERSVRALGSSPQDYARYIREEDLRWGDLIRDADIRAAL
jgi:tripartite-type tricarboxylate transporter receptor subunit TctC